jgi:two-component system, chemotaxis family, protein-glutamate methylesterase/glutaminase
VLSKPRDLSLPGAREKLRSTVKAMAQVKVVRRRNLPSGAPEAISGEPLQWVAIGSSTGGPPALCELLSHLPRDFRPTVVIAQHLAPGFGAGLCQWLSSACALPVLRVEKRMLREGGKVYLAIDGHHLMVEGNELLAVPSIAGDLSVPGVDRLFASMAPLGAAVAAAVLTGMGSDGAAGLLKLRQAGAYTLCQDESTSLIYGMPRVARERGAVMEELPLRQLAARIVELSGHRAERVGR